MENIHKNEEIDLVYLIGKIRHLAPYKFFLASMVCAGVISGFLFNAFISPFHVEIEYHTPKYKNEIQGLSFESALNAVVSKVITADHLKAFRDSNGYIYRFIISGDGQNAESARIQASNNSSRAISSALKSLYIQLVESYIFTETFIGFTGESERISGDMALRELEKRLSRLQKVRNQLLIEDAINCNPGIASQEGSRLSELSKSDQKLTAYKFNCEKLFAPIDADIMATRVDINILNMSINSIGSSLISDDSLKQFSQLIHLALNDNSLSAETLQIKILALVSATEKLVNKNSQALDRLIALKSSIKNYEYASKLTYASGKISDQQKKYKLGYCILVGVFIALLFSYSYIFYRSRCKPNA